MGTLRWLPIRCYFHWLMSLFLRLLLLQDWCYFICSACTKAKILPFKYVAKNPELIHDTPDFVEDFDSPICLAYTTATICLAYTAAKTITIFKMRLKSHKPWWYMMRWEDASDKGFIYANKNITLKSFKKRSENLRTWWHAWYSFCPFAMLLLTMLDQVKDKKIQKFLIQKMEKTLFIFTVHGLLFTDYNLLTLFTFTVYDTVHFEILPT